MITCWNVQDASHGTALYLAHELGIGLFWTTEADNALAYTDEDEAQADADAQGGEVFAYSRPSFWSTRLNPSFQLAAE